MNYRDLILHILSPREPVDSKVISAAAGVLLDNQAYQNGRQDILRDIVEKWLGSKPDATAERERLYWQAHALTQIDSELKLAVAKNLMKDVSNGQPD